MKPKKLIYFLGFWLAVSLLIAFEARAESKAEIKPSIITHASWWKATTPPVKETQAQPKAKPPIITHAFAVERGPYGYIWKIYIEAEAGSRDMSRIALVVDEAGIGRLTPDWIFLKPQYQKHLKGYIQWNTRSSSGSLPEWTPITLKVSIFDKDGNESNEVVFPFTFESGIKDPYQYKLPAPFDQGDIPRLGYINIDLNPAMGSPNVN
jgi:hypothetical protein